MFQIQNAQSLIGLVLTMAICWALSENRRRFPLRLAVSAVAIQVALVLFLFAVPAAQGVLRTVGKGVDALGAAANAGTAFVFGFLAGDPAAQPYLVNAPGGLFILAFHVLPVILVVCALSALLWHWKILKWIAKGFGLLFQRTLGLRGPPALAAAATVFMGQVEGPIFIRAYLDFLTRSELFMLLTVGMACVSGSTMVAYVVILKGVLPSAAAHVLTASIISAPAGVLLARIIVPPDPIESKVDFDPKTGEKVYGSSIDAVIKGTGDGLNIVLNVAATLVVFVALVAMLDQLLGLLPAWAGAPISIERILGAIFTPLAWAIGIPKAEATTAGQLLGVKLVLTEFSAFIRMSHVAPAALSDRSRMIMTYALCGFANIASVGINVAGYSILAPNRREEIMGLVWKAMLAGFLATCMTASVVGAMPTGLLAP
ncbi:MAG: nucleoside transporter C-terminal domain-containing protein [Caulobacteraceae bacterium]|nr:nucleoside transporter C-terminal domain-containing protein [Caulobacteraceae bacterium]